MEGYGRLREKLVNLLIILLVISLSSHSTSIFAKTSIGILPFENQTKKARFNWIGFGIEYILYNKLSNISAFYVPEQRIIKQALKKVGYSSKKLDGRLVYHIGKEALVNIVLVASYQSDGKDIILTLNIMMVLSKLLWV